MGALMPGANVLVVGDLHLDRWLSEGRDPFAALAPDGLRSLDALIIAGDLADKPKVRWRAALAHLSRLVNPARIHVVPGNHDYYHHVLDGDDRLARICAEAGVGFAQKRVVRVGRLRLLCCTLWTDFALGGDARAGWRPQAGS